MKKDARLIENLAVKLTNKILARRELRLTLNLECPQCLHAFVVESGPEFEKLVRSALGDAPANPTITREALERAVTGALRSTINDHGPITADKLTSATKRVIGNLVNAGVQVEGAEKAPSAASKKPR